MDSTFREIGDAPALYETYQRHSRIIKSWVKTRRRISRVAARFKLRRSLAFPVDSPIGITRCTPTWPSWCVHLHPTILSESASNLNLCAACYSQRLTCQARSGRCPSCRCSRRAGSGIQHPGLAQDTGGSGATPLRSRTAARRPPGGAPGGCVGQAGDKHRVRPGGPMLQEGSPDGRNQAFAAGHR